MANRLEFVATMDASGFEAGISKSRTGIIELERIGLAATARLSKTMAGGSGLSSMAEALEKAEAKSGKKLKGEADPIIEANKREVALNQQKLDRIKQQEHEASVAIHSIEKEQSSKLSNAAYEKEIEDGLKERVRVEAVYEKEILDGKTDRERVAKEKELEKSAAIDRGLEKRKGKLAAIAEYEQRLERKKSGAIDRLEVVKAERQAKAEEDIKYAVTGAGFKQRAAAIERLRIASMARQSSPNDPAVRAEMAAALRQVRAMRPASSLQGGSSAMVAPMFISVIRDSLASLGSGQSPITIFLQQAPQVAQAFTMMGKSAWKFMGSLVMMPLVQFGLAVVALIAVLALTIRHFAALREQQKNWRDLNDTSKTSVSDQVKVMKEAVDAHREQIEWLQKHGKAQHELKDATDLALKGLREKARFERELAAAQGKSKPQLAEMDIAQAEAELAMLKKAAKAAEESHHDAFLKRKEAVDAQNQFAGGGEANTLNNLKTKISDATAVADAIKAKMEATAITESAGGMGGAIGGAPQLKSRVATSADKMEVEVGGKKYVKSLADARDVVADMVGKQTMLEDKQKAINDLVKDKTKLTDDELARYNQLKIEIAETEKSLGLKKEFLPKIAGASGGITAKSDSLTSVGNFLGGSRNQIETLAKKQVDLLGRWLPVIASNTQSAGSDEKQYPT